jgi:hypothetical protein
MSPQNSQSPPHPGSEHPQARPRRTRFIIGGVVALVFIALVYFSPHISVYQVKRAAEANDIDSLKDRVDFPALRESLKEAAQDDIAKKRAAEPKTDNSPFADMGTLFAGGIANSLIDTMMTPKNFARLIRGETFDTSALDGAFGSAEANVTTPSRGPRHPHMSMGYESLNRFAARLTNLAEMDGSVVLVFTRSGLGWKLTGMRPVSEQGQTNATAHQPPATVPNPESAGGTGGQEQQQMQTMTATDLDKPEVSQRLRKLLGDQYDNFMVSFPGGLAAAVPSGGPVSQTTISACMPHACPWQGAALSIDLSKGTFIAGLQLNGEITIYGSGNQNLEALPQGMRDWIDSVNKGLADSRNAPVTVAFK